MFVAVNALLENYFLLGFYVSSSFRLAYMVDDDHIRVTN